MSTRQKEWNKHEAVLLLEAYLETLSNHSSRDDIVKRVSKDLRKIATNSGYEIDSIYRNQNGILFQMKRMESAYVGKNKVIAATKLFTEIVNIYKTNRKEYAMLLREARNKLDNVISNEENFMNYLSSKIAPSKLSEINLCYKVIESFNEKNKILKNTLFETSDLNLIEKLQVLIEQDISFTITYKKQCSNIIIAIKYYYDYIKDKLYKENNDLSQSLKDSKKFITDSQKMIIENYGGKANFVLVRNEQDKRLLAKYPIIYKRIFKALHERTHKETRGLSIIEIYKEISSIGRFSHIEDILDNVSWAKFNGKGYTFSTEIQTHESSTFDNYDDKMFEDVLRSIFNKGIRLNSLIDIKKFRKQFESYTKLALCITDNELIKKIHQICIVYDDRAYLPSIMLGANIRERLLNYIDTTFKSGKKVIFYKALFKEFSNDFLDSYINDADMLKAYLSQINSGLFFIREDVISSDSNSAIVPKDDLNDFMIKFGGPISYDDICTALPHLSADSIRELLYNNAEFIKNSNSEYFHINSTYFSNKELNNITEIIETMILTNKYIAGNELFDIISKKYPHIIENNYALSKIGFREALKYRLKNKFRFERNIISSKTSVISMKDIFTSFCRQNNSFTLDELKVLAKELNTNIRYENIYENSLRINKDNFVSNRQSQFNILATDEAIDRICVGYYIPIQKVVNFASLPDAGFPWNIYLLENYVYMYSCKYRLLHKNFNSDTCVGVVVKKETGFKDFDSFIIDILSVSNVILEKEYVLQYLYDEGYLAKKVHSNINEILIKAKAKRKGKEASEYVFI